ncbi:MAG: allantoicase [Candidatus Acidiferrales bacterium]
MNDFTRLVDLASARLGGRVLSANDEFFAPKENLLRPSSPVFLEGKFTLRGKWMDGWETRRRRVPGHDWCIVRLGLSGIVRGVVVDTSFFRGNYPESCSIEGCCLGGAPPRRNFSLASAEWFELLSKSALQGDSRNQFALNCAQRVTHLRLNIFPDGGVARLRVHGEVVPEPRSFLGRREADLAAVTNGGSIATSSDDFFGSPFNMLMPGRARNMGEGWETRRRRGAGHDWAIIRFGAAGRICRIEVDTSHFKGNFPESCSLEVCNIVGRDEAALAGANWQEILPRTKLKADSRRAFRCELRPAGAVTHARFHIYPDGGVARLRIFGVPELAAGNSVGLTRVNALPRRAARAAFLDCCGATRWAEQMLARRPFANAAELYQTADEAAQNLQREDWLETFRHHPPIGGKRTERPQSASAQQSSSREQSGVAASSREALAELASLNRAYRKRFGYIFIVCAAGKNGAEMISILRQRLTNEPDSELRVAAEEQMKITRLRLEKLLQ